MKGETDFMITIVVIVVLLVTNLTAFFLMGYDKQCAKKNRRRVPEKTLFLTAGLFGGLGGTLGMYAFRHKTKHWYFKVFFPVLMILQIGIIVYLFAAGMPGSV